MAGRLEGKIAFVTGGGAGMGKEHALLMAEEGATLIVSDVNETEGRQTVEEINGKGGSYRWMTHSWLVNLYRHCNETKINIGCFSSSRAPLHLSTSSLHIISLVCALSDVGD